jgi:50S ribosomal protein L16 3-hydroxylase
MISTLLGGLTPRQFLEDYWQKKPLLIRAAMPGFTGLLTRDAMLDAACRDDVESRLIDCGKWTLAHGPLSMRDFRRRKTPWTVLVQGVNLFLPEGDKLLREFDFIPYARLDDLMASYATDGGGVGPHFDNYDVFLLQGSGQRRWRIGAQKDMTLVDDLPLKILRNFRPTEEFVLNPGDMLYLPPQYAHDGIAVGECTTWSIGFRAPPYQELADGFLTHVQNHLDIEGRYRDPHLKPARHAAEIGKDMIDQVMAEMEKIRWDRTTVTSFLGCYLSEPKQNVVFDPPQRPLSLSRFRASADKRGLKLDERSQLLFAGNRFYINGEPVACARQDVALLRQFADKREVETLAGTESDALDLFHQWYCDGFLRLR